MANQEQRSHRRFPRVTAEQAILVRKARSKHSGEVLKTRTVGLGGCMFVSDDAPGVNSPLDLSILVFTKVVNTRARVVYQNRRDDGAYEVGVEFVETTPRDLEVLQTLIHRQLLPS